MVNEADPVDYGLITRKQQETWATGDFHTARAQAAASIALATPVPRGWSGDFFGLNAKYSPPPPPGVEPPLRWGTDEGVDEETRKELVRDLRGVFEKYNRATDGTAVIENTYRLTVATCA